MSQENVDKIRAWIEAYNRRDFDTALADFDPDVDWVLPEHQSSDSGRGTAAVLRFFEGIDRGNRLRQRLSVERVLDEEVAVLGPGVQLLGCQRAKGPPRLLRRVIGVEFVQGEIGDRNHGGAPRV